MNPDELFKDIKAIKALLHELSKRPAPATAEQLKAAQQQPVKLDAEKFAAFAVKALESQLPTTQGIKSAVDAGTQTITEAGQRAATQIAQASSAAANEIKWATRHKADAWANRIGFTTWKAALLIGLIPLLSGVGLIYLRLENDRQQTELAAWKSFGLWVSEKYPEVRKVYDRSDP